MFVPMKIGINKNKAMEIVPINKDIKVFYVTATSFPEGILKAHQRLHSLLPSTENRKFFGISYPDKKGVIIYKAAVEESFKSEAEKLNCETFIIPKGDYISETLIDWCKDETLVEKTFKKLLSDPRIDENGFCLEKYLSKTDIQCMVKLINN